LEYPVDPSQSITKSVKKGRLRICLNFSGDSFSSFSPKTCHLF